MPDKHPRHSARCGLAAAVLAIHRARRSARAAMTFTFSASGMAPQSAIS